MKSTDKKIDALIKKALSEEEAAFYQQLDEPSLPEMMRSNFSGKLGWLAWITTIMIFVWTALGVFCAIKFFESEEVKDLFVWGGIFFFLAMSVTSLKMFQWMQMNKNVLLREIKRLELQISIMAEKMGNE
ncbi:hypothetical protein QQ008_29680 [Fulvivirgaceae bacterium BMA10]|uniref:Uncharacterized protein n=1 Tax=Splendidivirga corallicola TaxID=3051826 RepID=A0ABT8L0B0_9BACT|nr:hypothetical protein [Fulvivirgaceae bacterium BMA10]